MKYIDAEKLKAEIERRINDLTSGSDYSARCELREILTFIDSLQQEQPEPPQIEIADYYYHKGVYEGLSRGRADALKILDEFMKVNANPVIVIKQQEQQEVDFEEELENWRHDHFKGKRDGDYNGEYLERESQLDLARHFYELGLKAKEENKYVLR